MDIEVVKTFDNPFTRAQAVALRCHIGARCGRIQIERRNRLGKLVCVCDCGETIALTPKRFASGRVFECRSCQRWRRTPPEQKILGKDLYKSFMARGNDAYQRCENPNHKFYRYYGGKGKRFKFTSIKQYAVYCGLMVKHSGVDGDVDRVDNDGNYEPGNIRIISRKANMRNRSNTLMICGRPIGDIVEDLGYVYDTRTAKNVVNYVRYHKLTESGSPSSLDKLKTHLRDAVWARRLDETHETMH